MQSGVNIQPIHLHRRADRNRFIDVPYRLHADEPHWRAPLRLSQASVLNTKKNPFFQQARVAAWLALQNGLPAGRIAAIVNPAHNDFHEDKVGFFGFFECVNDRGLAEALFDKAAEWLRQNGMETMRGPANPSTNDECGMLIDPFDKPPMLMTPYNPPYYPQLMDALGFEKAQDLYMLLISHEGGGMDERIFRIADRLEKRMSVKIRPINLNDVRSELASFKELYHSSWERNWGFVPLSDAELDYIAGDLKTVVHPSSSLFAEADGRLVGACVCLYDMNEILADNRSGRLFPLGLWRVLTAKKRVKGLRIFLLGVVPEYRNRGLDAVLYARIFRNAGVQDEMTHGEMGWVLESNENMIQAGLKMGGKIYKTYRIYDRPL
ncbi:MAG: N-acetyltransferase [Candidatus Poribacteria bacterium]|nr:N-acetyltransferase [Candidatus Poribacteria bacterium]